MQSGAESHAALLQAFGLSVTAFLVIVSCHLIAMHGAARLAKMRHAVTDLQSLPFHRTVVFILLVMTVLFSLHLLTNLAWALVIWGAGVLPGYRESIFFSLENYTSLGLTRVNVPDHWRMLAPMISLSGVFCLGWSTAMLITLFSHFYSVTPDK